jgi:peroxiredoxin
VRAHRECTGRRAAWGRGRLRAPSRRGTTSADAGIERRFGRSGRARHHLLVVFVYPHATGLGEPPVDGWDLIPGARGCTAQSCSFRDEHEHLTQLGAARAGLSVQTVQEQLQFAARVGLRYPLLSDPERKLAATLALPTFTAGGRTFYKRLTLICCERRVVKVLDPVVEPQRNAADIVAWLEKGPPAIVAEAAASPQSAGEQRLRCLGGRRDRY